MMERGFFNSDVDWFDNLSEEEFTELRKTQRDLMRTTARIEVFREEYRQLIREEDSEEELREIEDEILALQEEQYNSSKGFYSSKGRQGFCW